MRLKFTYPVDAGAFCTVGRRTLLKGLAGAAALTLAPSPFRHSLHAQPVFAVYPFSLGVASGDPSPDGFVIWTKIAPNPFVRGGGMANQPVEVAWAVASDERMAKVVQSGTATAFAELGHAVHVEVGGLEPGRDYHYRFTVGSERSRIGRAKTLPAAGSPVAEFRIGHAGCQRYEDGFFTAWRQIAAERFDLVFHYGDYIYEYRVLRPGDRPLAVVRTMPDAPDETYTLDDYRHRYAVYKSDPDLQDAHASAPFAVVFDDHEVANDWAGDVPRHVVPPEIFRLRRAAAFQAWYEHMPVRRALIPRGPDILAYRRFAIGDLVSLNLLDTRQFRSDQPCGDGIRADCKEALEPSRTMLGETQERWLHDGFKESAARWNVLGQQVMMMHTDRNPDPAIFATDMDKWDGAAAARDRLFDAVEATKLKNLVVLTGDIHNNWAGELRRRFDDASSSLGVELIATSISSGGDGSDISARMKTVVAQNPQLAFFNNQRGYVRHTVTPARWQADFQVLDKVSSRDGSMKTRRSLVVENGRSALADA